MKVFISGSESTGKTKLAKALAIRFKARWIPEYSREYIAGLHRPYNFEDLEHIAKTQTDQILASSESELVFFDTCLIITKVWFIDKYGNCPSWFNELFESLAQGYYLLCRPDIPWETDPMRENPLRRIELNTWYLNEITGIGAPYEEIWGSGDARTKRGILAIENWLQN